jgi:hypothetical protein
MSTKEKLLAVWKFSMSFRKPDWEPADYPVVIREQVVEAGSGSSHSQNVQPRYLARIVNWWVMTGGGETPTQAMADLVDQFRQIKKTRLSEGKGMPRPGTKVPVEFASSDRVSAEPELRDDFIQRILNLEWAFVSDESTLWDFHTETSNDALNSKIKATYGVDVSDLPSGNLADILDRIAAKRKR